jgi:hypothetical protein
MYCAPFARRQQRVGQLGFGRIDDPAKIALLHEQKMKAAGDPQINPDHSQETG